MLRATTACTFLTSNGHRIVQKWPYPMVFCHFLLPNVLRATTACTFSTSERPKVVRGMGWCFVHFYFEMCFAPQRRALFPYLNFQKSSRPTCFATFDFKMCFAQKCQELLASKRVWKLRCQKSARRCGAKHIWE